MFGGARGFGGCVPSAQLPRRANARASSCFKCHGLLVRSLLKDAMRNAQQNTTLARKSLGAQGMLVKVGVNRSHFSHPPSSYCAVTRHRYDARANERVSDLAHEVRGRAAPQHAIIRHIGRT